MTEKDITTLTDFNAFIGSNKVTVVDFHATWCGPCLRIAPFVHQKVQETGIALAKVDVDQAADIATKYNITSMPTISFVDRNGKVIETVVGASQDKVNTLFDHALQFAKTQ